LGNHGGCLNDGGCRDDWRDHRHDDRRHHREGIGLEQRGECAPLLAALGDDIGDRFDGACGEQGAKILEGDRTGGLVLGVRVVVFHG